MKVFTIAGSIVFPSAIINEDIGRKEIRIGLTAKESYISWVPVIAKKGTRFLSQVEVEKNHHQTLLHESEAKGPSNEALVVIKSPVSTDGCNYHTGDRDFTYCKVCNLVHDIYCDFCPNCKLQTSIAYKPFPLNIIATAMVGKRAYHYIGTIKKGVVFRTGALHLDNVLGLYHLFDGENLKAARWVRRKQEWGF